MPELCLALPRSRLHDRDHRAGRILKDPETTDARDVVGPELNRPAELLGFGDRRVGVVDEDVRKPVGGAPGAI